MLIRFHISILGFIGLLNVTDVWADQGQFNSEALLMGGGLKICSSFSPQHCEQKQKFKSHALTGDFFQTSQQRIAALDAAWQEYFNQAMPTTLQQLLERFNKRQAQKILNRKQLSQGLQGIKVKGGQSGEVIINSLTDEKWQFLLDHFQLPRTASSGQSLQEQLFFTNSSPHSQALVNQFIAMAQQVALSKGKDKATILVSTASSADVFDAVSFYTQLFKNKQTEVHWLPIEAGLNMLWQNKQNCQSLPKFRAQVSGRYDRQRIYPHLSAFQLKMCENPAYFDQLIDQADGLFLNGGDQTLTLKSLATLNSTGTHFSDIYKKIKKQFDQGQLVVAGTSAGTAVQSGGQINNKRLPMVSNGESHSGFVQGSVPRITPAPVCNPVKNCQRDELSYLPTGGFDLIQLGIFDTHFTERDRIFRLARLLTDTGTLYGLGIDENTGLKISDRGDQLQLQVIGEGATWVLEQTKNSYHLAALTHGARAIVKKNEQQQKLTWQFKLQPLDPRIKWQQWLINAQKDLFLTQLKWSFPEGIYIVDIKLEHQPLEVWPFQLSLNLAESNQ